MPQDTLKRQNVAALHNKVTGKGMPENVRSLPLWKLYTRLFQDSPEGANAAGTVTMQPPILMQVM
jgi:hypothetical protein